MRACLRSGAENGEHLSAGTGEGRVATAEIAAVRILVINSPSMIAIDSPVSGLKRTMSARYAGIPVPALPGQKLTSSIPIASFETAGMGPKYPRWGFTSCSTRAGCVISPVENAIIALSISPINASPLEEFGDLGLGQRQGHGSALHENILRVP